jgi:hypothetical protein
LYQTSLRTRPTDAHLQKNTAYNTPDKSNESDTATLITTFQQIRTGLQTADTEEDRFAVIMRVVYRLFTWK